MNTTSEIVKLATGLAAPYSVELDAGSSYTLQVLPREFLTLIRNKVLEIGTESSKIKSTKLVLTGPAGAGKSLLLYLCALDCHNTKNWLVWYIPSTKEYDDYTDNEMAGNLLGSLLRANIDVFTKYSTCENVNRIKKLAEKRDNKPSALREIVTMLLMKSEIPVFIGIDQWNCIQKQELLKELFGDLNKYKIVWGCSMLAVSSFFDHQKSGIMDEMDTLIATHQISHYNWEAVAQHYRDAKTIPDHATMSNDNLFKLTGRVPRLLMMVKTNYLANGKSWSNRIYAAIDSKIVSYFTNRIQQVIKSHKEKDVFEFAARAVINQYKYGPIPDEWRNSGIFERSDDEEVTPICPSVLRAMYECISAEMDTIVQLLADTEYCGTAFEIFIKLGFFNQNELKFPALHFDGTELRLSIVNKVDQDMPANDEHIDVKYSDNTMVICYQHHPVVDVVIYSQGIVNFVSIQSCTANRTNFDDFWTSKVGNSNYSILEYYCQKSPYSKSATVAKAKRWTEKLKSLVKFIIITPDTTKHNSKSFQDVIRISGESSKQFGTLVKYFQSPCC